MFLSTLFSRVTFSFLVSNFTFWSISCWVESFSGVAVVTTATPLNEATRKEILEKVMMLTKNKNVTLENKVDKNIIGGFILRVDDVQYNASVAHKLSRLQQEFQEKLFL